MSGKTNTILQSRQNQTSPNLKNTSRQAEINLFSSGEEAEEHRTSTVFYREGWGGKQVADSVLAFLLRLFSGLLDYNYQYELNQHHFGGIVHLQLIQDKLVIDDWQWLSTNYWQCVLLMNSVNPVKSHFEAWSCLVLEFSPIIPFSLTSWYIDIYLYSVAILCLWSKFSQDFYKSLQMLNVHHSKAITSMKHIELFHLILLFSYRAM